MQVTLIGADHSAGGLDFYDPGGGGGGYDFGGGYMFEPESYSDISTGSLIIGWDGPDPESPAMTTGDFARLDRSIDNALSVSGVACANAILMWSGVGSGIGSISSGIIGFFGGGAIAGGLAAEYATVCKR